MVLFVIIPLLALTQVDGPGLIEAPQFSRIVQAQHEDLRDYELIIEGTLELGPTSRATREEKDSYKRRYQSLYRYRSDGATFLEVYNRGASLDSFGRTRYALFGDKSEEVESVPDPKVPRLTFETKPRSPLQLFSQTGSPQRLLYHWYFEQFKDLRFIGYEHLGWELIDGHNCAKIKLFLFTTPPAGNKTRSQLLMWIDLERSANPLRVELLFEPPAVASRSHSIELRSFKLPGNKSIWFPIAGIDDGFMVKPGDYREEPLVRSTYHVVNSSLQFNQSPPDSAFSLKGNGDEARRSKLVMRKEFDDATANSPPPARTDRKSVQERLDQQLREADSQARMIEASSAVRESWGVATWAQLGFGGIAIFLLVGIFARRSGAGR